VKSTFWKLNLNFHFIIILRTTALEQLQENGVRAFCQMQDVPRDSLSHHLGFRNDNRDERDELDKTLARMFVPFSNLFFVTDAPNTNRTR